MPKSSWHAETITAATEETLIVLRNAPLLGDTYLAGGTGLALYDVLLQRIQVLPGFALVAKSPHTLHVTIQETKVSFLGYVYPLLFPAAPFLEPRLEARLRRSLRVLPPIRTG